MSSKDAQLVMRKKDDLAQLPGSCSDLYTKYSNRIVVLSVQSIF